MSQGKKRVSEQAPSTMQFYARIANAPKASVAAAPQINVAALGTHAVTPISAERMRAVRTALGR